MSEKEKDNQLNQEEKEEKTDISSDDKEESDINTEASDNKEEDLKAEIEELKKQLSDEKDKYLRIAAEYDNFRKRSFHDKQNAVTDATAKSVLEFLTVIDNFERAMKTDTSDENYKKGVELIFRQFNDILKKMGIEEIDPINQPFDPNLHHAVNQIEDENFGENTVCQVFQKGYKLGNKVVRCAMVVVANP